MRLVKLVKDFWIEIGGIIILLLIYINNQKEVTSATNRFVLLMIIVLVSVYYIYSKYRIINKNKKNLESDMEQIKKEEEEFLKTIKQIDSDF